MTLAAGSRLGLHEILGLLGVAGRRGAGAGAGGLIRHA